MAIRFIDENLHAWIDYPVAASLMGMPFLLGLGDAAAPSAGHLASSGLGCPVATVSKDIARGAPRAHAATPPLPEPWIAAAPRLVSRWAPV